MDLNKIDPNFSPKKFNPDDFEWHEITEEEFSIHGVYFDKESDCYIRLPVETAQKTSEGVAFLNRLTAGGRVRFSTNSRYIALQAAIPTDHGPACHMPLTGSHNFSIYVNGEFSSATQFDALAFSKRILAFENTSFSMISVP
jgi:hypothetical protein